MANSRKDKQGPHKNYIEKNVKAAYVKKNSSLFSIRGCFILFFAVSSGLWHRYHVSTLFENDRHFSHLSTLEREMTFRSEMGLYYSYFKTLVEAKTFSEGMNGILHNNLTEYPDTINTLERFNLLPEVVLGGMYKLFIRLCNYFNIAQNQCWKVDRGAGLPPVYSCEGIRQPEYFYLEAVWACAALTPALLFLYSILISDSVCGGILTVLSFLFNHGEATRVQWTPPLRESFAYPVCLFQLLAVTLIMKTNRSGRHVSKSIYKIQFLVIVTSSVMCLLLWQFSQFFLATQLSILMAMYCFGITDKFSVNLIVIAELVGVCLSLVFLFGNEMLLSSPLVCLLVSSSICLNCVHPFLLSKLSPAKARLLTLLLILSGALILKKLILTSSHDNHIINLLWSKVSDYKDFHTLLYTCSAEFDFLGWEPIKKMTITWLLPVTLTVFLALFAHWCSLNNMLDEPHIVYNVLQCFAFAVMAVFIMRLKLFFTPQLCLLASLITSKKHFKFFKPTEVHYAIVTLVVGGMCVAGFSNLIDQHSILGEYSNYNLEELLTWIEKSTPKNAVFAGSMPITAAVLLSTRRPIVNHPHYEDAQLRERTKKVYSIYSRKPPEEIYNILSSLKVDYAIISVNWCFYDRRKGGCKQTDLWDVEDPQNKDLPPTCPQLFLGQPTPFQRVFSNNEYAVLMIRSPVVQINNVNSQ